MTKNFRISTNTGWYYHTVQYFSLFLAPIFESIDFNERQNNG